MACYRVKFTFVNFSLQVEKRPYRWAHFICGVKCKVVPAYAVKAYRWSRGVSPLILHLVSVWSWVVNIKPRPLYLWQITRISIWYGAGWVPEPIWAIFRREKPLTPDCPTRSLITIRTTLSQLTLMYVCIICFRPSCFGPVCMCLCMVHWTTPSTTKVT
jgi:hypothetical protein